ncbi:hypothetical protein HYX05_00755 [Candidatus Woesearchaeota archaeon]|nr:hypothetical protein [Candidatus Woesearchaeota archaeon]
MTPLEAVSLDRLLSFEEIPEVIVGTSLDGTSKKYPLILRSGPYIFGSHTSKIAVHREKEPQVLGNELRVDANKFAIKLSESFGSTAAVDAFADNPKKTLEHILLLAKQKGSSECNFCYQNIGAKTPKPVTHQNLYTPSGRQVVSIPNIRPLLHDHHLTIFTDHILDLEQLTFEDVVNYFSSLYQLAWNFRSLGAVGIIDYMNFGKEAGASEAHPHAHRGRILTIGEFQRENRMAQIMMNSGVDGHQLMEDLMSIIKNARRDLYIFDNDQIFVHAMHAPIYPHHTNVIFKGRGNILDYWGNDPTQMPDELVVAARSFLGIFHGLRQMGVTAVGMRTHQSTFKGEPYGFMMQTEIYRRSNHMQGSYDTTGGVVAVPTHPTQTASLLHKYFHPN